MKNLMTTSFIAGAYLCLAGNAMAANMIDIANETELDGKQVTVTISELEKPICVNKDVTLGLELKPLPCPGLEKIAPDTKLKFHVEDKDKNVYCDKEFSHKKDANVEVTLHEDKTCTLDVGAKKARK
jgi:hypothetical protein